MADSAEDDVVIASAAAVVKFSGVAEGVTFKLSTAVWAVWWRLAREHTDAARAEADSHGEMLEGVMDHAMIAIVAASSALGGFAASLRKEVAGTDRQFSRGTPPEKKIFETIKAVAALGGKTDQLLADLVWLFDLRDPLVHPGEELREPVVHADRPDLMVSVESALYSASNAERALKLVDEIVRLCRDRAKASAKQFFESREILIARRLGEAEDS